TNEDHRGDEAGQLRTHKKAQNTPSAPLHGSSEGFNGQTSPDDDVINAESQNIPLMRVVMSKKQTKRKNNKVLKEGWVVHYTNQMNMRKKHYWRLDTKSLIMYQDETSTRYFKVGLNYLFLISFSVIFLISQKSSTFPSIHSFTHSFIHYFIIYFIILFNQSLTHSIHLFSIHLFFHRIHCAHSFNRSNHSITHFIFSTHFILPHSLDH
ncbi:unnamed protein product, partial [Strongylus vulgaris]